MPFPLAHPAAVLPLRRFCPKRLNFAALVIGSMVPDIGYPLGRHILSHTFFPGAFVFCLPVGLIALAVLYLVRLPVVRMLPGRFRNAFLPLCERPPGSAFFIVLSLLIGIWTHIFLDSIAHDDGLLADHMPALQYLVVLPMGHVYRAYDLFYAACTLFGTAWVAASYWRWFETATSVAGRTNVWARWAFSMLFGVAILFTALAARGHQHIIGRLRLGGITFWLLILFLFVTARPLIAARLARRDEAGRS